MENLPYDDLDEYADHIEYSRMNHPLTAASWISGGKNFIR